ncbi:putative gaf domain nucleotide-binding protein [Botryosphaeria dothidea]|uniref:Gaf domain nucleotide-binding protein n=1 Tax=Botryosphaeria dothidea TaxID=55169 RepID=A0A8H4JBN5_9PEZI|nr:putative gaf domain nucleotide-binding protein [Botryosphaeria dothidea]
MVHAESSTFAAGLNKAEVYGQVLAQAKALVDGQRNWVWYALAPTSPPPPQPRAPTITNTANVASLLWHAYHSLPAPSSAVNWAGFYVLDPSKPEQLILGPFQGMVACQTIRFGKGVCGAAAASQQTQLVPDVEKFPGHIACDGASKSEIVVPIVQNGKTAAIIDIDCAELGGFTEEDQKYLEELAALLADACMF